MESLNEIKENIDQSIRLQNSQRKTFLRLSGKSNTPKRISLQAGQLRKDADDNRQLNDIQSPRIADKSYFLGSGIITDNVNIDTSLTLAPHEIRDIMMRSEKNDITIREMMEDSTATGAILKANEPWREARTKLYYDFSQSMQMHFFKAQIFDIIADFIQHCTDTLDIMRGTNNTKNSNVKFMFCIIKM